MPEFGDLSSSFHGFLFTVTNKLPNKSLPDLLFVYSFEFLVVLMKLTLPGPIWNFEFVIVLDQLDCKCDNYIKTRSVSPGKVKLNSVQ